MKWLTPLTLEGSCRDPRLTQTPAVTEGKWGTRSTTTVRPLGRTLRWTVTGRDMGPPEGGLRYHRLGIRAVLERQRDDLEAVHVHEAPVGDLEGRDDGKGDERQGHEGRR